MIWVETQVDKWTLTGSRRRRREGPPYDSRTSTSFPSLVPTGTMEDGYKTEGKDPSFSLDQPGKCRRIRRTNFYNESYINRGNFPRSRKTLAQTRARQHPTVPVGDDVSLYINSILTFTVRRLRDRHRLRKENLVPLRDSSEL